MRKGIYRMRKIRKNEKTRENVVLMKKRASSFRPHLSRGEAAELTNRIDFLLEEDWGGDTNSSGYIKVRIRRAKRSSAYQQFRLRLAAPLVVAM